MSLRNAPASHRAFATSVLLVLGLGYLLAQVYLYTKEVKPMMDEGHGLVEGVGYTYNGVPTAEPKILVSLRGSMASTVSPTEFEAIKAWIDDGATEAGYAGAVQNVIEKSCASCHSASGYPPVVTNYQDTLALTAPDSGVDIKKLARMTHIHLLGIPLLLFMIGSLFLRTRFSERLKVPLVILPFLGVVWDIAHWWITKMNPSAALGIIFGGILMGTGFGLQWALTMWDVWMPCKDRAAGETAGADAD
jgi:mono/diheme cytochrome c family protein